MLAPSRATTPVLNSNLLRRLSGPLRARHPQLYSALNSVRHRLLARGIGLSTNQANAVRRFGTLVRLPGSRVLEARYSKTMNSTTADWWLE